MITKNESRKQLQQRIKKPQRKPYHVIEPNDLSRKKWLRIHARTYPWYIIAFVVADTPLVAIHRVGLWLPLLSVSSIVDISYPARWECQGIWSLGEIRSKVDKSTYKLSEKYRSTCCSSQHRHCYHNKNGIFTQSVTPIKKCSRNRGDIAHGSTEAPTTTLMPIPKHTTTFLRRRHTI